IQVLSRISANSISSSSTRSTTNDLETTQGANDKEQVMKIIFSCLVLSLAFAAAGTTAFAQKETANGVEVERDLALLRRDLRADKKKLIALNVPLTETEATKFWPVYDQYA